MLLLVVVLLFSGFLGKKALFTKSTTSVQKALKSTTIGARSALLYWVLVLVPVTTTSALDHNLLLL